MERKAGASPDAGRTGVERQAMTTPGHGRALPRMSRRLSCAIAFLVTLGTLGTLGACGPGGADQSAAGGPGGDASPLADVSGQPAVPSDSGCTPIGTPASGRGGAYSVFECLPASGEWGGVVRLHFVLDGSGGRSTADYTMDAADYSAAMGDASPRLWNGSILTLDVATARSGRLIMANHTDDGFVISTYDYRAGAGDSLDLGWSGDGFIASTREDGRIRLLPATSDGAVYGEFEPEWLGCSDGDPDSVSQSLRLPVDVAGRILAISYMSATQAPDGTALICSLEQDRRDGQSRWADDGSGGTTIAMRADDGGNPDEVIISRQGARYNVELRVRPWVYCGESGVIAHAIQFEAGSRDCTLVELAANDAAPMHATRLMGE